MTMATGIPCTYLSRHGIDSPGDGGHSVHEGGNRAGNGRHRGNVLMPVRIFDAHCDTILKVVDDGHDIHGRDARFHVDVRRLCEGGIACQVMACFASRDEYGDRIGQRSRSLLRAARDLVSDDSPLVMPKTARGLQDLGGQDGPIGILLAIEGGEALEGRPENVAEMRSLGVRYITLAWGDNDLTGASFGAGSGLTDLGKEVVVEMERQRILVDVSHMSDQAVADLLGVATHPIIASHSNCRALCDSPRNLTDDQIRAIADSGGVVGINFVSGFLTHEAHAAQQPIWNRYFPRLRQEQGSWREILRQIDEELALTPRPPRSAIADHVDHVVKTAGTQAVAFGSDFDGYSHGADGVSGCQDYPDIVELLRKRGYSPAELDQICWLNWVRVFSTTLEP
jgi:membrane dipeptidase